MIDVLSYYGEDFKAVLEFEGWKIGLLKCFERFASFSVLEKHLLTDEAFVLLQGKATIFIQAENEILQYEMESGKVYNVHKNTWHHIRVSQDAIVLVVENSNTSKDNTVKKYFDGKGDIKCLQAEK